jgi:hypothetical protein
MTPRPAEQQIADLVVALADARASLATGNLVDLGGLDGVVERAMAAAKAKAVMPDNRTPILAALAGLVEELERLSLELVRQHHAEAQRRAAAAYGERKP